MPSMRSYLFPAILLILAGAMLWLEGCGPTGEGKPGVTNPTGKDPGKPSEDPKLALVAVDKQGYDEFLARHQGKVVLVDYWAFWCEPCKEYFPHTVAMSKKYDPKQLAVVSLSFDDNDPESKAAALEFLTQADARFEHLLSTVSQSKIASTYGFSGAIPHIKLYDRTGKERYHFPEEGEPLVADEVEAKVKELLAE